MDKEGEAIIAQGALTSGFEDEDTKLLVISSDEFLQNQKQLKEYQIHSKMVKRLYLQT